MQYYIVKSIILDSVIRHQNYANKHRFGLLLLWHFGQKPNPAIKTLKSPIMLYFEEKFYQQIFICLSGYVACVKSVVADRKACCNTVTVRMRPTPRFSFAIFAFLPMRYTRSHDLFAKNIFRKSAQKWPVNTIIELISRQYKRRDK